MKKGEKRQYSNGEITVFWDSALCYKAAYCVRGLPAVFNMRKIPWVDIHAEPTEKIIKTVDSCPSGALVYRWNDETKNNIENNNAPAKITISANGPLLLEGNFTIHNSKGNKIETKERVALCRCGATENKPFCDGMHRKIGFKDEDNH